MSAIVVKNAVTLDESASSPSTPDSGNVLLYPKTDDLLYGKDDAGVETAYAGIVGKNGLDAVVSVQDITFIVESIRSASNVFYPMLLPSPELRKWNFWQAGDSVIIGGSITASGTINNKTTDTVGVYATWNPAAAGAASRVAINASLVLLQPRHNPYFYCKINTNNCVTVGTNRLHFGLFAALPPDSADLSTTAGAGFLLDTGASTTWKFCTSNGTTATNTSSGVTAADNTIYELECWMIGSNAYFSINRSSPTTVSATLPSSSTNLGPAMSIINDTGTRPTLWSQRMYVETN